MKKKNILNLIKYHIEENDVAFRDEAYEIAKEFENDGDFQLSSYIISLLSHTNTFFAQSEEATYKFLKKVKIECGHLPLPEKIKNDIDGIINAISHKIGVNKFLFEGAPGTGKTETVKHIARILNRTLYAVNFDEIIDSRLGQTQKNISSLFDELNKILYPDKTLILFDEIDALAIDRINANDLREMGRATSSLLKCLDSLNSDIVIIGTTNLYSAFDKALLRRFDSIVNFNRYSREDLVDIAVMYANEFLDRNKLSGKNSRMLRKIVNLYIEIPYPAELINIIRTSIAFSSLNDEYDYLKRLFNSIYRFKTENHIKELQQLGFTLREIEILTGVSKSQAARELKGENYE